MCKYLDYISIGSFLHHLLINQNLLNLSNWGLSSAWQQWRDEASWVNTSSENTQNRNHNLAMAALERSTTVELQDKASKDAMYQMIGKFGFDLLSGK